MDSLVDLDSKITADGDCNEHYEYSLEGLMLKLKFQYFGHMMQKNWLIGKDPNARKDWRQEKGMTENDVVAWHHRLNDMSLSKFRELVMNREAWHAAIRGVTKSWTRLSN